MNKAVDILSSLLISRPDIRPELGRINALRGMTGEEEKLRRGKISQPEILEQQVRLLPAWGRAEEILGWLIRRGSVSEA